MANEIHDLLKALEHPLPGIQMGLERVHALLRALGDPQRKLPPVVHVAGTNGKASTIAYMRALAEEAGLRVHVYSSPHLVRFNERIILGGKIVSDEQLKPALERVAALLPTHPVTFFEATTVAAFLLFAEHPADLLLLETGLGGRLDATNVIENPVITVITPVSFDHQEFLGNTLDKIAGEKAGIIKAGVPCILGPQKPEALEVLNRVAREQNVPLRVYGEMFQAQRADMHWNFISASHRWRLPYPSMTGAHQTENAATALAAVEVLAEQGVLQLDGGYAEAAMYRAFVPARMQRLTEGHLTQWLPEGWELWLDGGHNPAAGEVIAHMLQSWSDRPVYLIWGMVRDKDQKGFLKPIAPLIKAVVTVPIEGEPRSAEAESLVRVATEFNLPAQAAENVEGALSLLAQEITQGKPRVLICGSLYLAGKVLAINGTQPV